MKTLRAAILCLAFAGALWPAPAIADKKMVTVELERADVRQVLREILRGAGINHILDPGVKGTVTARLHRVPVSDALQAILAGVGCEAIQMEGVLFIRKRPEPKPPAQADAGTARADGAIAATAGPAGDRGAPEPGMAAGGRAAPAGGGQSAGPGAGPILSPPAYPVPPGYGGGLAYALPYGTGTIPGGYGFPAPGYGFGPAYPPAYYGMPNPYMGGAWVPVGPGSPLVPPGYGYTAPPLWMTGFYPF